MLKEDALQEIINLWRILRGKCFFYLELEERGQVGPSPYMDLCVLTFDAEKLARPRGNLKF